MMLAEYNLSVCGRYYTISNFLEGRILSNLRSNINKSNQWRRVLYMYIRCFVRYFHSLSFILDTVVLFGGEISHSQEDKTRTGPSQADVYMIGSYKGIQK